MKLGSGIGASQIFFYIGQGLGLLLIGHLIVAL